MSEKIKGGKRKGAGRKPIPDTERKEAVILWLQKKLIVKHGGQDKLKLKLSAYLNS